MNAEIFYFSGTGNSLHIAKELAKKLGGRLTPVASVMDREVISSGADAVGVVFPVYYADLPVIVKWFAQKLRTEGKYAFAVCSFGGAAGKSLKSFKRILKSGGGSLSAGFGVHMPQNAFHKPWEDKEKVYSQSGSRLGFIADSISKRRKGFFYTNLPLEIMMRLLHPVIRRACAQDFLKKTGLPAGTPMDDLVHALDGGFAAGEVCTGCGTCARVCPVGNITLDNRRPVWLGRCENCLACYDWCPRKAITGGMSQGYYYRHPELTLSEIAVNRRE
jgi:ferredoxin/flavodoxin